MTTDNCSDCCIITPENYSKPGFIPGFGGLLLPSHSIVPSSGTLSMTGLAREKVYDNYSTSSTPTGPYSMHDLTQGGNSNGSGISFESTNTAGPNEPNTSTPHAMSEWHGYDHDYTSTTNYYPSSYISPQYYNANSWQTGSVGANICINVSAGTNSASTCTSNFKIVVYNHSVSYGGNVLCIHFICCSVSTRTYTYDNSDTFYAYDPVPPAGGSGVIVLPGQTWGVGGTTWKVSGSTSSDQSWNMANNIGWDTAVTWGFRACWYRYGVTLPSNYLSSYVSFRTYLN